MRILMISNHLGVQSGVQRYVQNLLLNLDTTKYKVDLFVGLCPADQASTAPALIAHGVNIIGVPDHKKDRIRALYRHLKNHKNYDIIHYHTASKIGAPVCAMGVMEAKVEKDLRNGVNRRVNCETANLSKAVDASFEQLAAIRRLDEAGVLETLPQNLQETARPRRENPEATLSELAEMPDPPVSKSAINHRMRKLMELSKTL